jgi:ribonuclease HI
MRDEEGRVVFEMSESLDRRTNNEAEYLSLILGMERVIRDYKVEILVVRSDSELLVNQEE